MQTSMQLHIQRELCSSHSAQQHEWLCEHCHPIQSHNDKIKGTSSPLSPR